jgi:hypothetical protein
MDKLFASLIGVALTLGGAGGFFYGIFVILADKNTGLGIVFIIGGFVAFLLGTALGKFARGDYE